MCNSVCLWYDREFVRKFELLYYLSVIYSSAESISFVYVSNFTKMSDTSGLAIRNHGEHFLIYSAEMS
jgi:hypothetical protein